MKIKYILYVLFISLLSCKESIDETELIAQSSKVYITNSGYITNQILDMGNEVQHYDVYLNKSGYKDREANLILKYQNDIVDHYIDDMDEIFVLPESCLIIDGLITLIGSQIFYTTNLNFLVSDLNNYQ